MQRSLITIVALLIVNAYAYHTGPGDCTRPGGSMAANPADSSNGGFAIVGLPASYTGGQAITVTLTGTENDEGFIIYAESSNGNRYGSWTPASTKSAVVSFCDSMGDDGNSIGHTENNYNAPSTSVSVGTWTAPATSVGDLTFKGVAVHNINEWYFLSEYVVTGSGTPPATTSTSGSSSTGAPSGVSTISVSFALIAALFSALAFYLNKK